jgi:hypothetical protein
MTLRLVVDSPEAQPPSRFGREVRRLQFAIAELDVEIAATADPTRRADLRLLRGKIERARELLQDWEGAA